MDGLSLAWDGEPATAMTLMVTPGAFACADDQAPDIGGLYIPATAAITTGDGRWDGSFPIGLVALPDEDGALARVSLEASRDQELVASDDFVATFGLEGIDFVANEYAGLGFTGEFTPGGMAAGEVVVHGYHNTSGGAGTERVDLARATWSAP